MAHTTNTLSIDYIRYMSAGHYEAGHCNMGGMTAKGPAVVSY